MNTRRNNGHTLVELLVAMGLAAVISVGVASLYVSQNALARNESQRDQTQTDAHFAFDIVSRLLRQARQDSIQVTYPASAKLNADNEPGTAETDGIVVDFLLPEGYPVWPNDKGEFSTPAVRLSWTTSGQTAYQLRIGTATKREDLANSAMQTLAGGLSPVINLDVWPLNNITGKPQNSVTDIASGGYLVRVTARTAGIDASFTRTDDKSELAHVRTYTVSGSVAPRN
ncbi:MAG: prepilin-type N-terminal cleavage/methylation domain-containing protein [Gammaproteobacteria bacterium]|nr:prepilin-type N-terminal cleavage/methylation domain-containing protein [Gammaproteobacteria bacterium]